MTSRDAVIAKMAKTGATGRAIGTALGISKDAVRRALRKQGLALSRKTENPKIIRSVVALIRQGLSANAIYRELGVTHWVTTRIARRQGIAIGWKSPSRAAHHAWKGGRCATGYGYVRVIPPEDFPWPSMLAKSAGRPAILEHRMIMAQTLGRALKRSETVHHINGDRADNRPENLQLRQGSHGQGQVLQCRTCGAQDIVPAPIAELPLPAKTPYEGFAAGLLGTIG